MQQKPTAAGCELRFRPVGTPSAKTMDELDEGRAVGWPEISEQTTEADNSKPFSSGFCLYVFVRSLAGTNSRLVPRGPRVCYCLKSVRMISIKFFLAITVSGKDMLGFDESSALLQQEVWSSLPRKLMRAVVCERGALHTARKRLLGPEQNTNGNIRDSSVNTLLGDLIPIHSMFMIFLYCQ